MTGSHSEEEVLVRLDDNTTAAWHHTYPFSSRPLSKEGLIEIMEEALSSVEGTFRLIGASFGMERLPRGDKPIGRSYDPVVGKPFLSVKEMTDRLRSWLGEDPEATAVTIYLYGSLRIHLPSGEESESMEARQKLNLGYRFFFGCPIDSGEEWLRLNLSCEHYADSYGYIPNYDCTVASSTDYWFLFRLASLPIEWRFACLRTAMELARLNLAWRKVKGFGFTEHFFESAQSRYPDGRDATTPLGTLSEEEFFSLESIPKGEFTCEHPKVRKILSP